MTRKSALTLSTLYSQDQQPPPVERPTPAPAPSEPPAQKPKATPRRQVNFHADPETYDRFKYAHRATLIHTNHKSLNAHLNELLEKEVARLEREYNGGKPFGQ